MSLQKTEYDIPLVWDSVPILDLDRYEVWRAPYLPIVAVNQGTKKFTIDGTMASWFEAADALIVTGSTGNDGSYTVIAATETATQTIIEVSEAIPSAVADGYIGKAIIDQLAKKTKTPAYTDKNMRVGFYYYVVYAVDDRNNFSDPSNIIIRYSPLDYTAPTTPTGLIATRDQGYETVSLKWNDIEDENLKGYIVNRTLNPRAGTPTWEVIAVLGTTSKYKDSEIPLDNDPALRMTEVAYAIQSYDKSGNVSTSTAATYIFTIPLIRGLRTSLDYLSINVFWDLPLPEDGVEAVAIFYRKEGSAAWTFDGAVDGTKNSHRIDGPLLVGRDYEIGVAVVTNGIFTIVREEIAPSDRIYVDGDETSKFTLGDTIAIIHSAGNDGLYTLGTVSYISGITETRMEVTPGIIGPAGIVTVDQTLGYIGIAGDVTANWTEDKIFIYVLGSAYDGVYTIDKVVFDGVNTRLYVEETIGAGAAAGNVNSGRVLNITTSALQVPTDLVSIPEYEADTTIPTSPFSLLATLDPLLKKVFLNWSRVEVEDDFLEFYVDISPLAADFPITGIDAPTDKFTVAGDQSAYFVAGDEIYAYGGTNNNGWHTIVSVTVVAGPNTEIVVDSELLSAVIDGTLMSDRAWWNLDKTRNTNFQAFYNYVLTTTYRFRIRAADRSENLSIPTDCVASVLWDNSDLTGGGADPLMLPQWVDYTEQALTTYKHADMRRYALLINDGPSISEFFRRYVLYIINRPWTPVNQSTYFNLTKDEVIGRPTFNTHTYETFQVPDQPIVGVNQGAKTFSIAGDYTAYFTNGDIFRISGSTGNNGQWTVVSSTFAGGNTVITVTTAIPDATVDGVIDWSIYVWPAIEDNFRSVWVGPTSSIRDIPAT